MSQGPRIVIARGSFRDAEVEMLHVGQRAAVDICPVDSPADVLAATRYGDALVVTVHPLTADHINSLGDRVRVIGRAGIGLDAIDLDAAALRGIAVFNLPGYATHEVATHTLALMLALQRRLMDFNAIARADWSSWQESVVCDSVQEQTLGLVGMGRIGTAVAGLASAFFKRVITYDPYLETPLSRVEQAPSLHALLRESDVVSLHLPLTTETQGLMSADQLEIMKPSAILINVARGELVDEASLAAALHSGSIAGAGLDVLEHEPPSSDSPLLTAPNVIMSPHVAWYSRSSEQRVRTQVIEDTLAVIEGRPLRHGQFAVPPRHAGRQVK